MAVTKLFTKNNILNFLFVLLSIFVISLLYEKYIGYGLMERFDIIGTLTGGTNEPITRADVIDVREPEYYVNKFSELDNKYRQTLHERKQAHINHKMNPGDERYEQTFFTKDSELNMINSEFQSAYHEFVIDSEKVKNKIGNDNDNIGNLIDEHKERRNTLSSLKGSDLTAKRLYSDYVLNYNNSYKTILFTIMSILLFVFIVYNEVKKTSGPFMDSKEVNKQIAKTLAVAVAFGVTFVLVYNLIIGLFEEVREKDILGEKPSIYKLPSYSIGVKFIDKTKETDNDVTKPGSTTTRRE